MGVVYYIKNKINDKYYIGLDSTNYQRRWKRHVKDARRHSDGEYIKHIQLIDKKIAEYGVENFEYKEIYFSNNFEELKMGEKKFIQYYNSFVSKGRGYNLTLGGDGCFGFVHSPETIIKLKQINKGKKLSEKTKKEISKSRKGRFAGKNHPNYGKHLSKETKQKISKSETGKIVSEETKKKQSKNNGKYWLNKQRPDVMKRKQSIAMKGMFANELNPNFKHRISKEELYNYYIAQNNTLKETMNYFKCSEFTILRNLRKYNIYKGTTFGKNHHSFKSINKKELVNFIQNHTLKEAANYFRCSTDTIRCRLDNK